MIMSTNKLIEINYFGMVALVRNFIPHLIKSKGKIIIIGSTAGIVAVPFAAPYASSKFAVEGFSDSLAKNYPMEWIQLHVPGPIIDWTLPKIMGMDYGGREGKK
jgi:short-subunit dehydrogenase